MHVQQISQGAWPPFTKCDSVTYTIPMPFLLSSPKQRQSPNTSIITTTTITSTTITIDYHDCI